MGNWISDTREENTLSRIRIRLGDLGWNAAQGFRDNSISTTKYTLLSFLPVCLLLQFFKLSNLYFLMTAVLSCLSISPTNRYTSFVPLMFVCGVAIAREGYEDWRRKKQDEETNKQYSQVYRNGAFVVTTWDQLQVGDLVLVEENQIIPADLLLLTPGECFLQTATLDGERNLKLKTSICDNVFIEKLKGEVECGCPNCSIYSFHGSVRMDGRQRIYGTINNLLLRGSILSNTKCIVGAVIFAGMDSKIMLNQGRPVFKITTIEKMLDKIVIASLILQAVLCVGLCIYNAIFVSLRQEGGSVFSDYLFPEKSENRNSYSQGFLMYYSYFLLLATLIPISLVVTLETIKFIQAFLMESDIRLYSFESEKFMKSISMTIHEQLAVVDYIFSDKTGTLTRNEMCYKKGSIGGEIYDLKDKGSPLTFFFFSNSDIFYPPITAEEVRREYWLCISLCNEVIPIKGKEDEIKLQSSCPDEVALIEAAKSMGLTIYSRTKDNIALNFSNSINVYKILKVIPFSSIRRRMSIIVENNGKIILYCKGADSVIKSLLNRNFEQPYENATEKHLEEFSRTGLRTLCIAYKVLEATVLDDFFSAYEQLHSIQDPLERQQEINALESGLEKGLFLLGASAIEDRLQEGVPETIKDIKKAGMKIWMLTGDKKETAESIGVSCGIFHNSTHKYVIDTRNYLREIPRILNEPHETAPFRPEPLSEIDRKIRDILPEYSEYSCSEKISPCGLLVDGECVPDILQNNELAKAFVALCDKMESVVVYRASPNNKSEVVRIIKEHTSKITLSIGDGGNDVSMIKEANVGIGIFGKEGFQAAHNADYSIGEFQHLWRLLFVHGRWNGVRLSYFICFFFYKNLIFTLPQVWFAFMNGASGLTYLDDFYCMMYNTILTALPIGAYGTIEQDVQMETPTAKHLAPSLYCFTKKFGMLNMKRFLKWMILGIYHSLIVYFIPTLIFNYDSVEVSELWSSHWSSSFCTLTSCVLGQVVLLSMDTHNWTALIHFLYWVTGLFIYFPCWVFFCQWLPGSRYKDLSYKLVGDADIWLTIILTVGAMQIPVVIYRVMKGVFWPTYLQRVRSKLPILSDAM